jgi:hypothetical protein
LIIKCGLRFAVCVLYIFVSELTLYVHAPANCGNTALAELTTSWQSCYRCRRRRRRRCCCCCCCCCCCYFCFSPQKRQTHLKPLIAASPSVSSYVLLYATVLPLCPITGLGSRETSFFRPRGCFAGLYPIVGQTNEQSSDTTSNKIKTSHMNISHKHTTGISCKTDGIEKYQTVRSSPEIIIQNERQILTQNEIVKEEQLFRERICA